MFDSELLVSSSCCFYVYHSSAHVLKVWQKQWNKSEGGIFQTEENNMAHDFWLHDPGLK